MGKKVFLKIARGHNSGKFNLGKHVITHELKEFELNEDEVKELESEGPSYWLTSGKPAKKAPAKKETKKKGQD